MKTDNRLLAIIPARGGSKGVPRKNVRPLAGRPLITYSISAALEAEAVSRVIVSTDDAEIEEISLAHGAEVLRRPAEFATDQAQAADVVYHVLTTLADRDELPPHFVLLQPTSPLRTAQHVQICYKGFLKGTFGSAISVSPCGHHPMKAMTIEAGTLQPLYGARQCEARRQDLPEAYDQNGAIYMLASETFLSHREFCIAPTMPFVMDRLESVDIDTPDDFQLAENLIALK